MDSLTRIETSLKSLGKVQNNFSAFIKEFSLSSSSSLAEVNEQSFVASKRIKAFSSYISKIKKITIQTL